MIGLFFEVIPLEGHASHYFELAAVLKPELERSGGVLFIDRYTSTARPGVILSHQWWADEEALVRWRQHTQHRAIQRAGREQHFKDYRLRIGPEADPLRAASAARTLWVSYYDAEPAAPVTGELFNSVYRRKMSGAFRKPAECASHFGGRQGFRDHARLHDVRSRRSTTVISAGCA